MRDINSLILGVFLSVSPNKREIILERLGYYKAARQKQPKGKSCGCVFKNEGISSGKLIDAAGLKGTMFGCAQVSFEHANFIINYGTSSADVKKLIDYVKAVVFEKFGVSLHEEVVFVGDFD
jgi:UDP-N-acetylmuramate dehydrogenase